MRLTLSPSTGVKRLNRLFRSCHSLAGFGCHILKYFHVAELVDLLLVGIEKRLQTIGDVLRVEAASVRVAKDFFRTVIS